MNKESKDRQYVDIKILCYKYIQMSIGRERPATTTTTLRRDKPLSISARRKDEVASDSRAAASGLCAPRPPLFISAQPPHRRSPSRLFFSPQVLYRQEKRVVMTERLLKTSFYCLSLVCTCIYIHIIALVSPGEK